ncbi:MAG: NfeD family protein [Planctomycetota bacterium]
MTPLAILFGLSLLARAAPQGEIHVAELRGIVHPLSAGYLIDSIDRAEERQAALLVIEIDTPGGLVDPTKEIVQRMLAARTPIAVHVSPSGARAASAGFLLLLAADVAAMSPGTNTGAAHPVDASGSMAKEDIGLQKAESDLAAFARTIAKNRGRNVELAERAVTESVSFTEEEALEEGLVDIVAKSRADLIAGLDGRTIRRFDGSETVLDLKGPIAEPLERSTIHKILGPLLRPELVLLLLGLGMMGLYAELSHPGLILPGVVGVLCLLLFALAFQFLPMNTVGLLVVALGLVLFVLELKVVSHGLLALGGIACLIVGLMMVFPRDIPALRVSWSFVLPLALAMGGSMAVVVWLVTRARSAPVTTGTQGMVGETGWAETDLQPGGPEGRVHVHGELWSARTTSYVTRGEEIRVVGVEGMRLLVQRKEIET